jgi:hypothetical protein
MRRFYWQKTETVVSVCIRREVNRHGMTGLDAALDAAA